MFNIKFAVRGKEPPMIFVDHQRLHVVSAAYQYYTATEDPGVSRFEVSGYLGPPPKDGEPELRTFVGDYTKGIFEEVKQCRCSGHLKLGTRMEAHTYV